MIWALHNLSLNNIDMPFEDLFNVITNRQSTVDLEICVTYVPNQMNALNSKSAT